MHQLHYNLPILRSKLESTFWGAKERIELLIVSGRTAIFIREVQLASDVLNPPDVFPLTPINKLWNIECCVNNMLQIILNMMFLQGLELELSMFRRTTVYQVSIPWFRNGSKIFWNKYSTPPIIFQWVLGVEYFWKFCAHT